MSVTLETRASERVNGRCADCGQFIDRNSVHFHGPKRRFRGAPRAHLWNDGGGMVSRCDDVEQARTLLIRKYAHVYEESREEAELAFPEGKGEVQRGRINVVAPDSDDVAWWWVKLDANAKGPGVTTAVVWHP